MQRVLLPPPPEKLARFVLIAGIIGFTGRGDKLIVETLPF